MTLTAVRALAFKLPPTQQVALINDLVARTAKPMREPVSLKTLERRSEDVRSGRVKALPAKAFHTMIAGMKADAAALARGQRRSAQRG